MILISMVTASGSLMVGGKTYGLCEYRLDIFQTDKGKRAKGVLSGDPNGLYKAITLSVPAKIRLMDDTEIELIITEFEIGADQALVRAASGVPGM
jgi:hypothetical protein